MVKQWDATMDGDTRPTHRALDGQIRETDKPFESSSGRTARYPGDFGDPAEDCNCRCVALTRARWALGIPELNKRKGEAAFHGFDKSDGLKEFTQKYMKAAETENSLFYAESERITKSKEFAVDPKAVQSRAYAEKFDRMASTPKERREYLRAAKEMLQRICICTTASRANGSDQPPGARPERRNIQKPSLTQFQKRSMVNLLHFITIQPACHQATVT